MIFLGLFAGFTLLIAFSRFFHGVAVAIFANLEGAPSILKHGVSFGGWALARLSLKKYAPPIIFT